MKLNMLAPKLKSGFIRTSNEAVSYLELSERWTQQALEEDIKSGAKQLKECLELVKKRKPEHMVLIKCNKKEDGLMAAGYIAAISNLQESRYFNDDFYDLMENPEGEALLQWETECAEVNAAMEPLEECEECLTDDELVDALKNSAGLVPVISGREFLSPEWNMGYFHERFGDPYGNSFCSISAENQIHKKPYWMQCTVNSVCILIEEDDWFSVQTLHELEKALLRFAANRHVFIAWCKKDWDAVSNDAFAEQSVPDLPFDADEITNADIFQFVLRNNADVLSVKVDEKELRSYRVKQFEDWAEKLIIRLEKRFPKRKLVETIVNAGFPDVSDSFRQVLQYVKKESRKDKSECLTENDFSVLDKFNFRVTENKKDSVSVRQLESELIGLETVKQQLKSIVGVMKLNRERERHGMERLKYQNVYLLIGAPGTAKTTVARLFGKMMHEEGLLPGNRFTSVNGAELKGMYVGHSAPKTKYIFENNDVILIDEAYSLTEGDEHMDVFSKEALAQLILEVEKHGHDKLIMFAGYGGVSVQDKDNKMKRFLDANPGLKSRINATIYFDSYTPEQMVEIVHKQAELTKLEVSRQADEMLLEFFQERIRDTEFGNGREARRLVENAVVFMAERVMQIPKEQRKKEMYKQISAEDIVKTIAQLRNGLTMQKGRGNRYGFL